MSETAGAKPLTPTEQATLDDLLARKEAAETQRLATERADKLASMVSVEELLKVVKTDKIDTAINTALNDPLLDFETKQLVKNLKDSLTYTAGTLASTIQSLKA